MTKDPVQQQVAELPVGSHPDAIVASHFPDRLHAFVWRNWHLVPPERIAETVGATTGDIITMAASMGLPPAIDIPAEYEQQVYMTLLRRNWHLLPYEQLLILLDMSVAELNFILREDFFLFIKLGSVKPKCAPLAYCAPDDRARNAAARIKATVERTFAAPLTAGAEPRFEFIRELRRASPAVLPPADANDPQRSPRVVCSYFGVTGDPLMAARLDPYPDGLLARYARLGVTGVWLHVVLRQLAPGGADFPEFGDGYEQRLANLRDLVGRAQRYGIAVYLYLNEPRAMPRSFFDQREDMAGVPERDHIAMCTSDARVRGWMRDALTHVFTEVPGLGGVFTISASENLTHCASHSGQAECPRCADRTQAQIVGELHEAIEAGVHRGNPDAHVIVWDWGWNQHGAAPEVVEALPQNVWLMSVSEWAVPIERGGVKSFVDEYAICVPGPGPRAALHWQVAAKCGLKTMAKVQLSTAWELSTLPYLPVLDLVAEHCANLTRADVDGMFLSWALGGYPSLSFEVARRFAETPDVTIEQVLDGIAADHYGPRAVAAARQAWTAFSDALREFPYSIRVLYNAPHQFGPANPLYPEPTGYPASLVGIPYDDLARWGGPYPSEVFGAQFEKVATRWSDGLPYLEQVVQLAEPGNRGSAADDLGVAQAAQLHFASVARQVRFVMARDALRGTDLSLDERTERQAEIRRICDAETEAARQLFELTSRDSRIGYASENQYIYTPLDLVEKVINCEHVRDRIAGT